jgi:hypothetical protein
MIRRTREMHGIVYLIPHKWKRPPEEPLMSVRLVSQSSTSPIPPSAMPKPQRSSVPSAPLLVARGTDFALALPPTWSDRSTHLFAGPTADGLRHAVTVAVEPVPSAWTAAEFADGRPQQAASAFEGGVVLLEDPIALGDGRPAQRAVIRGRAGSRLLYQEHVYVVGEKRGATLVATFTDASRRSVGADIEAVIRSFVFAPAQAGVSAAPEGTGLRVAPTPVTRR